jgi:MoaA/NifB/PqqE/SkfB family radical SAM enzyme
MSQNPEGKTCLSIGEERLAVEVTTRCNSACLHCFVRAGISRRSSLPVDVVKEIIAEGFDAGYRELHITGGEPLLWEGLFEALDDAFETGYKAVSMNTNGTLLTKNVTEKLAAYGGLSISVSLEGAEAPHDRLRGKGSYRRTVRGIEKALDAGIELAIFTTVRRSLIPELPHFADDLYRKFPSIKYLTLIQLIRVNDGLFALLEELLEPEDFLQLVQTVACLNLCGLKTEVLKNPLVNVAAKLLGMPWVPKAYPLYREGSTVVRANRSLSASHSSQDRFGRYRPGMIHKVLASDAYRKAVAPDETICPSCEHFELCRENGMVRPSEGSRRMHTDLPYCVRVLERAAS